ncbi:MAG: 30S ribosome-binding factor RbfA [Candidatus Aureabacteria bacterium]|nr:30S ribosome-binding factor RbfA [Candidatus Auribacterota bacterium]
MAYRIQKVNSLLLKEINKIVCHKLGDARIGFVTLTGVSVSKDLRNAKVFVSSCGDKERDQTVLDALNHARRYVQYSLASAVFLKYIPEVKFFLDDTQIKAERIEELLEEWHKSDDSK